MMDHTKVEAPFRWFAWHPVDTGDRGWRWLRFVWRQRVWYKRMGPDAMDFRYYDGSYWLYRVDRGYRKDVS